MTKVTTAKVAAQAKARKELWFGTNNKGRMSWSMKWGDKWTYKIRRSSKAEVKDYLAEAYGLTIEEFVAIENGDYEIEDATVEIDPAKYAVSIEAQEVAIEAEMEIAGEKSAAFKTKVAEFLNKPRKKIIDWKTVYKDCAISEMKNLQKEFKNLLRLGEIELAENIFNSIKTFFKQAA